MTDNFDKITAEYRQADFNKRLHMYLQFPRLRSDFILIDQDDLKTDLSTASKFRKKSHWAQIIMILSFVPVVAKKIFSTVSA